MSVSIVARKIRDMEIRGALDIAIAAAKAMRRELEEPSKNTAGLIARLKNSGQILKNSRPTAVSLPNSINYVLYLAEKNKELELGEFRNTLSREIKNFIHEQNLALEKIAEIGSNIIQDKDIILTHCNSDTVLAILHSAWNSGKKIRVFCTETRPRYQGHISARELSRIGIPVTLIVDSAARFVMEKMKVDRVLVGGDTVYANGVLINKIGTSQIASSAKELEVEFLAAVECIKFSPESLLGKRVKIEDRSPKEVLEKTIKGVKVFNPAFDLTMPEFIDLIITEEGAIPPHGVYSLLKEKFSWEL